MVANFLLVAFVLLVLTSGEDIDQSYTYADYCRQFGKNQTQEGKKIFESNYKYYLKKRSQGERPGLNSMFDLNQVEMSKFMGRVKNPGFQSSSRPKQSSFSLFASPTSFDWRALGRVTPVKSQGGCGSCWAFAATGQYQSALAIATNGTLYDLSQQYGVECDNSSIGCSGGDQYTAMRLFNSTGVPTQAAYPYKAQSKFYTNLSQNICVNTTSRVKLAVNGTGPVRYSTNTIQQIQSDLVQYGPASVGVYASGQFFTTGSTGSISCSYRAGLNHAILLVGYNSTHWFVKNSWGQSWGNNGFAYISKTADCGLTTDVVIFKAQYKPIPPPPPPVVINITLTILMTDSGGNGWEGNKISFRQNGVAVGEFGSTFTSGNTSGPISITIDGKKQTQVVATAMGTNSNQVGFVIKYPNGTIAFTKNLGAYTAKTIFTTFCPLGGCSTSTIGLTITMTDSYNDGWQKNVIGLTQFGINVGIFGEGFINGSSFGPVIVTIPGNYLTQIVPAVIGSYTHEIGFTIKAPNGTIILKRTAGTAFNITTIFSTFCPLGNCINLPPAKYYTSLVSSCSDWGKNVLGIRQDGEIIQNWTLGSGNISTSIQMNLTQFQLAEVIVVILGEKTWQIGFSIRTEVGTIICQRLPGTPFEANSILCSWTPGRAHQGLVYHAEIQNPEKIKISAIQDEPTTSEKDKSYFIAIITVLESISGLLLIALCVSISINVKKMGIQTKRRKEKKDKQATHNESLSYQQDVQYRRFFKSLTILVNISILGKWIFME